MNEALLSMIKRVVPDVMAAQLLSVQPMTDGRIFTLRAPTILANIKEHYKQGDLRHSFIHGWQRYYGTEWISNDTWIKIKVKRL